MYVGQKARSFSKRRRTQLAEGQRCTYFCKKRWCDLSFTLRLGNGLRDRTRGLAEGKQGPSIASVLLV